MKLKVSELSKLLKKNTCYLVEHSKEHDEWYSEITKKSFRLSRQQSKEIATGALNRILKDAELR